MAPKKAETDPDDAPLKRLGGGRWQTRDERFTIEPQSGTWVVVDAEQTDDLGLQLVRGPFPSLTAAKEAIASARSADPAASPLAARLEGRRREPTSAPEEKPAGTKAKADAQAKPARKAKVEPETPEEPTWLADLAPAERGRARRQVETLAKLGVTDPQGVVRRDVVGDVPAIAAEAIHRALSQLDDDASPDAVAELLAEGRDSDLGVRWRLVDGDGRPIVLEPRKRTRRRS